jgi:acyl-CoA thioester hydrolase
LNNSVYNLLFDTIINKYLIEKCDLIPSSSSISPPSSADYDAIALVIESHATFIRPLSFPSRILLGMRIIHIGKSSVKYEVGVFGPLKEGDDSKGSTASNITLEDWSLYLENSTPAVVGGFTHVFVDRQNRKPITGMTPGLKRGLNALLADDSKSHRPRL